MRCKKCLVPQCTSTSVRDPKKMFVSVPSIPKIRRKWLQLAHKDPDSVLPRTNVFMCEDHFDMDKVVVNYMQYKLGFCTRFILAPDALPTKFSCQDPKKPITDSRYAQRGLVNRPSRDIILDCRQSQNAPDDHVETSQIEPETDIYVIEGCEIVEIDGMHFIVELEESQPDTEFLEVYISQDNDSNLDTVSNEELEQSPDEEPQPKVPLEEVYIKQEVDPNLYIIAKEELPEECQPNVSFEEVYIKQEPEEYVAVLVKGESLYEICEDQGILTEHDLPGDCQPKIQFEAVYINESAHI